MWTDWDFRLIGNTAFGPIFPYSWKSLGRGALFFLSEHAGDCPVGGLVHLYVPDVDAWHREFQQKGIPIEEPPNENLPGLRSMMILDPNGNKLHICTRLPNWSRA
jgi:hypothetical protein